MTDAIKPTAGGFPLLSGERLEAQQAMEWVRAAKTQLTPDQAALIAGQEPRSVLKYRHSTVLPPLIAGNAGGITQNAVETRDALIQTTNDSNLLKTAERDALISELEHSFFIALEIAVEPNAPLLLRRMKRECAQAAPHQHSFMGSRAWAMIVAMTEVASMLVGEAAVHDAALVKLDLAPLPKGANGDAFSKRVTEALELHIPFLTRPFPNETAISYWVCKQAPHEHAVEVRTMYKELPAADKARPHLVAGHIVELMAAARDPAERLREGLAEFVCIVGDDPPGPPPAVRRPGGMGGMT